jgi:ABC-2 type transport system ATP-binding protein
LQLGGDDTGEGLEQFGTLVERTPPRVRLRVERQQVTKTLAAILAGHAIEDVAVEDPPLEEVIAELFAKTQSAA